MSINTYLPISAQPGPFDTTAPLRSFELSKKIFVSKTIVTITTIPRNTAARTPHFINFLFMTVLQKK